MASTTPLRAWLLTSLLLPLSCATPVLLPREEDPYHKNLVTGLSIAGVLLGLCIIFFLVGIFFLCTKGTFLCIVRPSKNKKALAEQEAVKRMEEIELRDMERERRRREREAEEGLPTYQRYDEGGVPGYEQQESNVVDPRAGRGDVAVPAPAYYVAR